MVRELCSGLSPHETAIKAAQELIQAVKRLHHASFEQNFDVRPPGIPTIPPIPQQPAPVQAPTGTDLRPCTRPHIPPVQPPRVPIIPPMRPQRVPIISPITPAMQSPWVRTVPSVEPTRVPIIPPMEPPTPVVKLQQCNQTEQHAQPGHNLFPTEFINTATNPNTGKEASLKELLTGQVTRQDPEE